MNPNKTKKQIIAGPCAMESREQLQESVQTMKELDVGTIRASLWKPRTQPGWEGLGTSSLPVLLEETLSHGITPATEVISAEHAESVVNMLSKLGDDASILVWLGARNQNHLEQKKISKILADGPKTITFMFKNQVWDDERHWMGIFEHILQAGFPIDRLWICHRGFSPGKLPNPEGFRNLPDFEMAMRIKERTGIPMIIDPSHIGGSSANVFKVVRMAQKYDFDGYIIEVHSDPEHAKTDARQQLSPAEFKELLKIIDGETTCKKSPIKGCLEASATLPH